MVTYTYTIKTGNFKGKDINGNVVNYNGYSGAAGSAKNNPSRVAEKFVGPIPPGTYTVGGTTSSKGPLTLILTPHSSNQMYERDAFRIHGDSIQNPGTASQGCIILNRPTREKIKKGDKIVVVAN